MTAYSLSVFRALGMEAKKMTIRFPPVGSSVVHLAYVSHILLFWPCILLDGVISFIFPLPKANLND